MNDVPTRGPSRYDWRLVGGGRRYAVEVTSHNEQDRRGSTLRLRPEAGAVADELHSRPDCFASLSSDADLVAVHFEGDRQEERRVRPGVSGGERRCRNDPKRHVRCNQAVLALVMLRITRRSHHFARPATVPGDVTEVLDRGGCEGDAIVIHVRGEVDVAAIGRLRDVLEPHMGPQQTIVLDLSGVEFMDSASLRFLVHARGDLTADGGSLKLRNPSVSAHRLLTLANAEALLEDDADQHRPD